MAIDADRFGSLVELMSEAFPEGPFRDFMEEAGRVILRKLKERGLEGVDPSTLEMSVAEPILLASWIEAAITSFPGADEADIVRDMTRWFDMMKMDREANADGGDTPQ